MSEAVCTIGDIRVTSRTAISGDFDSHYRLDVDRRFEPEFNGRSVEQSVVEVRWLGACKPDQRPGDVILSAGKRLNVVDRGQPGR